MAIGLPSMAFSDGIRKYKQTEFKGYNHRLDAQDGELWDMENLTSDYYPLLSPRKQRYIIAELTTPNGFYAHDGLYWVDGTDFYADGTEVQGMTLENNRKRFASLGAYIVILPDKKYYNRLTGEYGSIEASWSGSGKIQDGTYAEEAAEANTIYASGASWGDIFTAGDAVEISGCTEHPENNKTIIIREIDGDYLRFYENSFIIGAGGDTETNMVLRRRMPDVDFICENENRLWACKGDTIYCSKLGDIFNWNVFDGVATDSFAVDVGSTGDFTGCCAYLGYPVFFKEEHIYKVYGDKPSNFQVMGSASLGVEEGSDGSIAIAGEMLFYLSRVGIVCYTGGIPQSVAMNFGTQRFRDAIGGSDGTKYYVSMRDTDDEWHLFVYDTRRNLWHREDWMQAVGFGWNRELYFLDAEGTVWLNGNAREIPENAEQEMFVESIAEFGDFIEKDPNHKGTAKIQVRMELEEDASVTIEMQFDSDGVWHEVKTLTTAVKRSYYLPIIPRRSDHFRIRFIGTGQWRLYSLVRENYSGSEL